jgi:hypothetical protein
MSASRLDALGRFDEGASATRAPDRRALRVGGAAIGLGALGVVAVSLFYAVSPAAVALPSQPLVVADALKGAIVGAATLRAAGSIGVFADIVLAVGALLVAFALASASEARASAGWIALGLASFLFVLVDALAGFVLSPLGAAPEGAGAFLGFKRLFDVMFLLGAVTLGGGGALAMARELRSPILAIGGPVALAGIAAGIAGILASLACFLQMPAEQGVGLSVAANAVVFTIVGWRMATAATLGAR